MRDQWRMFRFPHKKTRIYLNIYLSVQIRFIRKIRVPFKSET